MFSHMASAARVWSASSFRPPVSFKGDWENRSQYGPGTCIGEWGVLRAT